MIKKFFECLADYARKENDLSDITVALCRADPTFKKLFVEFFFKDLGFKVDDIKDVRREVPSKDGNSRVDIMIEIHGEEKPCLIEVKKYDENHHFEQYVKAYNIPQKRLGYITNYELKKEGEYVTKTWGEFYDFIKGAKDEKGEKDVLIEAYCEYLKKICYLDYDKRMDLYNKESEDDFRRITEDVISSNMIPTEYYKKYQQNYAYGFFFSKPHEIIDKEKGGFGVFYFKPGNDPQIFIVVHSRKMLEESILSNIRDDGNYYLAPKDREQMLNASSVAFRLKDNHLKNILEADVYKKQLEILRAFYAEVIGKIKDLI